MVRCSGPPTFTGIQSCSAQSTRDEEMSLWIYLAGYCILITGLAIGAHLLKVPQKWIGVGALCLIGLAVIHGVKATRQKDPPS